MKKYRLAYLQNRNRPTNTEKKKLTVIKGQSGEGQIRNLRLTYTHYYKINDKDLLHHTGNYPEYLVINYIEKNLENNWCLCITKSS